MNENNAASAAFQQINIQFPGTKANGRFRFGMGLASEVGTEASGMAVYDRALLVTDATILSLGLHRPILRSLAKAGIAYDVFDRVEPEPHMETVQALCGWLEQTRYGVVIGLGGGSALDIAKLAGVLAVTNLTPSELFDDPKQVHGSLPTILLPTTSGTGSEVSPYAVVSDGGKKRFIASPHLYATVAMVDPELTMTMPPRVTAATGLDALTHGVEGVIGKDNPYTRAMARECVRLVFTYLPRAVQNGDDREARGFMALASVLGMLAYTQGGGLYAHSMSYVLTTGRGCPHGLGCGLTLPYTLRLNRTHIGDLLRDFGTVLANGGAPLSEDAVIARFLQLVKTVGMPASLKELGVGEEELPAMAYDLVHNYYRALNPVALTEPLAAVLLRAMYDENVTDAMA